MPTVSPSITEQNLYKALGDLFATLTDAEIVQGQVNRVAMPAGPCVVMSPGFSVQLATPVSTYTNTQQSIEQATQWAVQIDCYGDGSAETARVLSMIFRTGYAADTMAGDGFDLAPLYADDPKQLSFDTGNDQYTERWTFNAVIQYNPVINTPIQSMTQISIGPSIVAGDPIAAGETITPGTVNVDRS